MDERNLFKGAIYYSSSEWFRLVGQGIVPFFKLYCTNNTDLYLFLADYRGQHIRLMFNLKETDNEHFDNQFKKHFKAFIAANPSTSTLSFFKPGAALWMDFENNTVETGNYQAHFLLRYPSLMGFSRALSNLLLSVFAEATAEEPVDVLEVSIFVLLRLMNCLDRVVAVNCLVTALQTIVTTSDLNQKDPKIKKILQASRKSASVNAALLAAYLLDEADLETTVCLSAWEAVLIAAKYSTIQVQDMIELYQIQLGLDELSKIYCLNMVKYFLIASRQSDKPPA